jgi:hypothetical protein
MVQATVAKFGRVDYAVNCAGEQSILFLWLDLRGDGDEIEVFGAD